MNRLEEGLDDSIEICSHVGVPEAQNALASGSQEAIASSIIRFALNMLTPVQFDYDPAVQRSEVADVESDLMLPSELEATELSTPQTTLEKTFGIGLVFAKTSNVLTHGRIGPHERGVIMSRYTTFVSSHDPSAPYDGAPPHMNGEGLQDVVTKVERSCG